jgi:hypothetical protein
MGQTWPIKTAAAYAGGLTDAFATHFYRRHIDFRIRCVDRSRAPLRRDEVQVVKLAVVIQLPRSKRPFTART